MIQLDTKKEMEETIVLSLASLAAMSCTHISALLCSRQRFPGKGEFLNVPCSGDVLSPWRLISCPTPTVPLVNEIQLALFGLIRDKHSQLGGTEVLGRFLILLILSLAK